jgi:hypothetical protein
MLYVEPAGTRRYLRKSKIITRIRHDPWEYDDPEPRVHNLRVFLAGTCGQPADDPHSWCALIPLVRLSS